MTLQKKLVLTIVGGLAVVLPITHGIQYYHSRGTNRELAAASSRLLQERESRNVESLHRAVELMVADALARGEMNVFDKIIGLQREIPGFAEFSLYDRKGQVTHSSDKVQLVDRLVAEVACASKEQSQGITQLSTAVLQMDRITQGNAANAEESASAAEQLTAQAGALKTVMVELQALVESQPGPMAELGRPADQPPKPSRTVAARALRAGRTSAGSSRPAADPPRFDQPPAAQGQKESP